MAEIPLKIEFGGGLELLFDNKRSHRVTLPARVPSTSVATTSTTTDAEGNPGIKPVNITYLIHWLKDNLLRERVELFIENETVYVKSSYHLQRKTLSQRVVQATRYTGPCQRLRLGTRRRRRLSAQSWRRDRLHFHLAWGLGTGHVCLSES